MNAADSDRSPEQRPQGSLTWIDPADSLRNLAVWMGAAYGLNMIGLIMAPLGMNTPGWLLDYGLIGFLFGSIYVHTTLSAAWFALGVGRPMHRFVVSLAWFFAVTLSVALAVLFDLGSGDLQQILFVTLPLVVQWAVLQPFFWGLYIVFGLSLESIAAGPSLEQRERAHFGIRHLLVAMAVCGLFLAIIRATASLLPDRQMWMVFLFLAAIGMLITVPLVFAVLVRRGAIVAIVLAVIWAASATFLETPLFAAFGLDASSGGPDRGHFISINAMSTLILLVFTGIVRANGFALRIGHEQGLGPSNAGP